ncbi:Phosphatidate cytidylyltransferase [Piscirickettsia salmonis]|uniref:Phosphatidate cytidylyltransferase n=1 Tax=Piscirickettsia salmonis TaxID=1238 RepID=A0A1L6T9Q1_PISSA|nr:phosphatidate cytidylyltransferase [Piscirickettsia salmonis]AKP73215.1 hypothetical protein PSLF89_1243 [Piscirickettsia salmonis LF-89 = ATCC VR-1361]ALB21902.1 cytidylyltransferase family protein [Piscirickettsia salmonis]ALY02075.1 hypothetical protein AWE47_03645 [Piscirickettsia salmonis]AMA41588.1 hypothetical protein AWJ11_03640 [Piscirickettsia salmonis]AOS34071.1 hypothetical protein AVM72_00875 [Piscirickettsia salmonis]
MLKQRVFTGAGLIIFALLLFFIAPKPVFAVVVLAVIFWSAWEWANLSALLSKKARFFYSIGVLILVFPAFKWSQLSLLLALLWWCIALLAVVSYPRSATCWAKGVTVRLVAGLFILLPAVVALLTIYNYLGAGLLLSAMALVWAADIGAYFTGRAFGRRKLAVAVSPGKSWEGLAGGVICSMMIGVALLHCVFKISVIESLIIAVCVSLVSVLGDLTESMAKRERGIKDSGHFLPGHGGILDRLDGVVAGLPIFLLLWQWLSLPLSMS